MSTHIQKTIRELEQELEVKQEECADIERALIPLRRRLGLMDDGSEPPRTVRKVSRRVATVRRGRKAANKNGRQTDRQTDRQTEQGARQ